MRVLYFTRGDSAHDRRFLAALGQTGHEVHYLRLETGSLPGEGSLPSGVHPVAWQGLPACAGLEAGLALLPELSQLIERLHPDVIHAGPLQRVARLVARIDFHPLVSMSWGSDLLLEANQDAAWMQATCETLAGTDILVGDCQAVKDKALGLGFAAERVVLFPWGVDLRHFTPQANPDPRVRAGWEGCFTLLSMRSWEPLYGVDLITRAFVQAAKVSPELRLLMLSSGSQGPLLREILKRGGVIDRVTFAGQAPLAQLPGYYTSADLYLSASHSDGSSVSLLEAMACGRPALVSDIPGNREWVIPGENGWLFPDGDVDALAQGMVRAVQEKQRLADMGRKARQIAEERADWEQNFPKLLQAYEMAVRDCNDGFNRSD
ncbi:MAG: glycosyltransferase family 4 protein [Anaerolineaceae bacterium]|nr:glycosyltransferase family 4 protein [Anaerolineaceae bacterium]